MIHPKIQNPFLKMWKCDFKLKSMSSFEACPPMYVKNPLTVRTCVVGILEVVYKKWDQAAAKHQPARQNFEKLLN